MRKTVTITLCVIFITMVFVSGCNKTAQKPQDDNTSNSGVQQTSDADKRIMASRFSNIAMDVNGVQKATVVVSSTTSVNSQNVSETEDASESLVVMAGLTLNTAATQDKNQENQIKEEVKTKIMQNDQRVNEVLVTTDTDMIKKLQDVAEGVIQGQPVQSYAQDIDELDKSIRSQ